MHLFKNGSVVLFISLLLTTRCSNNSTVKMEVYFRGLSNNQNASLAISRSIGFIKTATVIYKLKGLEFAAHDSGLTVRGPRKSIMNLAELLDKMYSASFINVLSVTELSRVVKIIDERNITPHCDDTGSHAIANELFFQKKEDTKPVMSVLECLIPGDDEKIYLVADKVNFIDSLLNDSGVIASLKKERIPKPVLRVSDTLTVQGMVVVEPQFTYGKETAAFDIIDSISLSLQMFVLQKHLYPSFTDIFPEVKDISWEALGSYLVSNYGGKKAREMVAYHQKMTDSLGQIVLCKHQSEYPVLILRVSRDLDSISPILMVREKNIHFLRNLNIGFVMLYKSKNDTLKNLRDYSYAQGTEEAQYRTKGISVAMIRRDSAIVFYNGPHFKDDKYINYSKQLINELAGEVSLGLLPAGLRITHQIK